MIKEILSTADERHSFLVGLCHAFYRGGKIPQDYMDAVISKEFHYYTTGRLAGQIVKVTAIVAIITAIWRRRK